MTKHVFLFKNIRTKPERLIMLLLRSFLRTFAACTLLDHDSFIALQWKDTLLVPRTVRTPGFSDNHS